jgi:hypothetical protein
MSAMFIEVNSLEKNCKVIINLDTVMEIAPIAAGGCALFFPDAAAVGGKTSMKVSDSYALFKQFVLETVSPEDIAKRIQNLPKVEMEQHPRFISDLETTPRPQVEQDAVKAEQKRGPGRPKSVIGTSSSSLG